MMSWIMVISNDDGQTRCVCDPVLFCFITVNQSEMTIWHGNFHILSYMGMCELWIFRWEFYLFIARRIYHQLFQEDEECGEILNLH